ncbi:ABC transporter permease [uncultured Maritimibacter sp.]|jgi:ABC-type nitrate/sulfonate/bicarbonate transport system permease component|uniref:ABC transporter permease n=1 Tax=uncultured Maritimibacter sp. TaxID=991866 RepID=UPI0026296DB1|nr:ABC transporter permease [uncultured Maritimibacter sp.]
MKLTNRFLGILAEAWLPVALIVLWWLASAGSTSLYFPPLAEIVSVGVRDITEGPLLSYAAFSLTNLAAGLAIAIVVGVVAGVILGSSQRLRDAVNPYLQFIRSVPQVALVPLIIGALGIGALPKIWSISFACVWPVLLNTIDGVKGIDTALTDFSKSYRLSKRTHVLDMVLPAALPQIVPGVRTALAIGVIVMVVSEIYGADSGLGYYILQSGRNFAVAETWAGTILVGLLGYLLSRLFEIFEHFALRWHRESSAQARRG